MDFQNVLEQRRSIRKYDAGRKATKEQLEELLTAGSFAPSWKNSQTARIYCAYTDEMIEKVAGCLPEFNRNNAAGASALLVSTFVRGVSGFSGEEPTNEIGDGWGCYDLGLHDQCLVLKAQEMGLGTLIMGIRDSEKLREVLDIPAEEVVLSVIAVGYPAVEPKMPARKTLSEVVRFC